MTLEAILAYAHLLAILTMVVFISSEAALCRSEWMNAAVVERLVTVDLIYGIAAVPVLLTGLARIWWGVKGSGWYWTQPAAAREAGAVRRDRRCCRSSRP